MTTKNGFKTLVFENNTDYNIKDTFSFVNSDADKKLPTNCFDFIRC